MDVQQFLNYLLYQRVLSKKQMQICLDYAPSSLEALSQILLQLRYITPEQMDNYFQSFQTTLQEGIASESNQTLVNPQMNLSKNPTEGAHFPLETSTQNPNRSVSRLLKTSFIEKNRYLPIETLDTQSNEILKRVHDRWLEREVYEKRLVIPTATQENSNIQERFYQEASLTAQLEHPNIIPLYNYHQDQSGSASFTFRKLDGNTLEEWLSKRTSENFAENRLISLFLKICDAVAYAHAQNISHGNLQLTSIQVGAFGEVYVTSWGKAQKGNDERPVQEDIPALGRILQACYATLIACQQKQTGKASSRRSKNSFPKEFSEFPPDIQAIIRKATHRDWRQRYISVQSLAEDLTRYTKNLRLSIRQYSFRELLGKWIRRHRRQCFGFFLFVFLFITLASYATWSFYQDRQRQFTRLWLQIQEEKKQALLHQNSSLNEKTVHHLLKGLNLCNVAFSFYPQDPQIEKEKWELGKKLITLTCAQENYSLAYSVIQDLDSLSSIEENEKKPLREYITTAKRKLLTQHLQQLDDWIKRLKSNFRENNLREEAILEISRFKEPEVAERLLTLLQEGTQYFIQEKKRTSAQEEFYGVIPCILGRMSHPEIPQALWDALQALYRILTSIPEEKRPSSETHYMVLLAQALTQTQEKKFILPLFLLRYRMGEDGVFAQKIKRACDKFIDLDYLKQLQMNTTEELSQRGTLLLSKNDYLGAIADFSEAIRLNPNNTFAYNSLAVAKHYAKDFDGALATFQRLLEIDPQDITAYQNRGNVYFELKQWDKAISDWTQMIRLAPNDPKGYTNRGNAKRKIKDFAGALEDYNQSLALDSKLPEVYMNRGIVKKEMGDFDGAMADYNQALSFHTHEAIIVFNRGVLKLDLKDPVGAEIDFSQAIRLNASEPLFYYHRGLAKKRQGQKKQALDDLNVAQKLNPDYPYSYFLRGEIKMEEGDLNEALKNFEKMTLLDPQHAKAYLNLGLVKSYKQQFKEAIKDYTQAIQLDPQLVDAYHNRAVCLINERQFDRALDDLNQALKLQPENTLSYFTRGQLYVLVNDHSNAKKDFQEYVQHTSSLQDRQTRSNYQWIEKFFPELVK